VRELGVFSELLPHTWASKRCASARRRA
jgi:hypothetical protein